MKLGNLVNFEKKKRGKKEETNRGDGFKKRGTKRKKTKKKDNVKWGSHRWCLEVLQTTAKPGGRGMGKRFVQPEQAPKTRPPPKKKKQKKRRESTKTEQIERGSGKRGAIGQYS